MLRKLINKLLNICDPYWKGIFNMKSDNSNWEFWNDDLNQTITIHYVPEDNYSDKDVKITIPYNQFEDLVKLIKKIDSRKCNL